MSNDFTLTIEDGIGLLVWDKAGRSMNVITAQAIDDLAAFVEQIAADEAVRGCVIVSGKEQFSGGADITMLQALQQLYERQAAESGEAAAMQAFFAASRRLSQLYRRIETCGKPFVAAIHGICLGGAFELALACHHRVVSDADVTRVGLPEIKIGIFPGAGGTQRVSRLMQTGDALQMMFRGEQIRPLMARNMGLVHQVVPRDALVETARAWIRQGGSPVAPWDQRGFKLPSNKVHSPAGLMIWPAANAIYRRETHDNYPAAKAILQSVYEGLQLPMDQALTVESRYFAHILRSKEAAAMIRTVFVSMQDLGKGARRPAGQPPAALKRVGIIGAGFMGAGIAYVSAQAGLDVVLIDRDLPAAEIGKALSHKLITDQINRGRAKTADREALLARIRPSADYADLADCDLVVEAVFEDPAVKAEALARAEAVIRPDCILASNTSTLPITGLAASATRPARILGIHFFSPVEKMLLVEVIRGRETGERALATALDFVRAIKKTPIVVNDSRGFFANRCVGAYLLEGHLMLTEGLAPALIENAGRLAGMPVGPLSLSDEVALDLLLRIVRATKIQLGAQAVQPSQEELLVRLVDGEGRLGRKNRKGFYDYPETGPKRLWPGLAGLTGSRIEACGVEIAALKDRLLMTQALEAARTVEEGVVTDPREADVGSILGFGFAPYTGGALSYIDGIGAGRFVARCRELESRHGARFAPNRLLVEMAETGGSFYDGLGQAA